MVKLKFFFVINSTRLKINVIIIIIVDAELLYGRALAVNNPAVVQALLVFNPFLVCQPTFIFSN